MKNVFGNFAVGCGGLSGIAVAWTVSVELDVVCPHDAWASHCMVVVGGGVVLESPGKREFFSREFDVVVIGGHGFDQRNRFTTATQRRLLQHNSGAVLVIQNFRNIRQ